MANNTLPEDITKTINDIIEELDEFSKKVTTEYTLAGSVAVYLFVYSLYVNERDAEKKESIKTMLTKLHKPNDIDIIIYTQGRLPKEIFRAYKKIKPINKNNTIHALNSINGLPIQRRETPIFKIDLIIINLNNTKKEKKEKKETEELILTFTHNGVEKKNSIVHPQNLISLYKNDDNRTAKQRASNLIKRSVLEDLNKMKLLPEKEKPVSRYARASMRRMSFGKENSPSSATKRKRRSNTSQPPSFGSPSNTKKAKSRLLFN